MPTMNSGASPVIARAKLHRNILTATGILGAGGDAGRDFETDKSTIAPAIRAIRDERNSGSWRVGFGCTLQVKFASKIKSDLATIAASNPPNAVAYFFEADVPIAKRNELIK